MTESTRNATLSLDGQSWELPVHSPTAGPDVIDIRTLYGQSGLFTYDPGFTSTASCDSTITFIDGDKGELLHRGYPIDQLASKSAGREDRHGQNRGHQSRTLGRTDGRPQGCFGTARGNQPLAHGSLKRRGSLSIWFDPEMVWVPPPSGKRGRQQSFGDAAI